DLSDEERAAVVDYVVTLATPAPGTDVDTTESAEAQPVTGDVDRGRRLFVGSTGFDNGGAACASCHQAGDVGHRGGSSLGPDLDASHTNFGGEAGLAAWLAAPASPTMQPIFVDRPLTEPEIADLVAFLETAPERPRPRSYGDGLLLGGLVGLGVLLGGMAAVRRTMNPSYSQRLRSRS
ncbi:MAG: cytochrome c, partial [Acidimicrobiia bacterium]|nr:cytochrome c [Acidimicrobiia bacterium]